MRALVIAGNILAIIVLLSLVSAVSNRIISPAYDIHDNSESRGGLFLDEDEVTNIFAYGPDGALLDGVQLFTSDGRPIITSFPGGNGCLNWWSEADAAAEFDADPYDDGCRTPGTWLPGQLETGAVVWNVFPMRMAESTFDDPGTPVVGAAAAMRTPPFVKVPAIVRAENSAENEETVESDEAQDDAEATADETND